MVEKPKCKKVTYSSEREAESFLTEFQMSKNRHVRRESRSYHCPRCGLWHLTSQKAKERKQGKPGRQERFSKEEKEWLEVVMQLRAIPWGKENV